MEHGPRLCLLEYDERFEVFEEFVRYDFKKPVQLRAELRGTFDRILVDPPYHSEECLRKCEILRVSGVAGIADTVCSREHGQVAFDRWCRIATGHSLHGRKPGGRRLGEQFGDKTYDVRHHA